MAIPFPSEAWIKALMAELNQSAEYAAAASEWEGDFVFTVSDPTPTQLYLDLWHGQCRAAYAVTQPLARPPTFTIEAPLAHWRKVLAKQVDPIQAIVTRQLKLTGPLVKVMRAPKAAVALVNCAANVPTLWPD
jgi:putative sterol carrier protein